MRRWLQVHRLHAPLRHFSPKLFHEVNSFLDGMRAAANLRSVEVICCPKPSLSPIKGAFFCPSHLEGD